MHKGLMLILDGLGDRPNSLLNGLTPLESAHTPVMDKLLAAGSCGLVDPLSAGVPVDTHTGTGALMGFTRKDLLNLARGPIEAAGIGIDMQPGDILLRANFATLDKDGQTIIDRRAGRISKGTTELSDALQDIDLDEGISASVFAATHHRAVVRLRGENLSPEISSTDPCNAHGGDRLLSSHALDPSNEKAQRTARALNRLMPQAFAILQQHPINLTLSKPANGLLTRGAGICSTPINLLSRLGLQCAVISGDRTLHGLGNLLGFDVIYKPAFSATHKTDLGAKFSAVRDALDIHDMVYLHIKATDILSHDKNPVGKRDFLQKIDSALGNLDCESLVIGITGDHSTDSNTGNHCGDPVPSLLYAPGCRIDSVRNIF